MPGPADGLELASWTLKLFPHTAVILTSGDKSRTTAMRELCPEDVFEKPYSLTAVSERMRAVLENKKPRKGV